MLYFIKKCLNISQYVSQEICERKTLIIIIEQLVYLYKYFAIKQLKLHQSNNLKGKERERGREELRTRN